MLDLVEKFRNSNRTSAALFWAKRAYQCNQSNLASLEAYAQCLFDSHEYRFIITLLHDKYSTSMILTNLYANSLFKLDKLAETIKILDPLLDCQFDKKNDKNYAMISNLYFLRGLCYERKEQWAKAISDFTNAFLSDPTGLDAFDKIESIHVANFESNTLEIVSSHKLLTSKNKKLVTRVLNEIFQIPTVTDPKAKKSALDSNPIQLQLAKAYDLHEHYYFEESYAILKELIKGELLNDTFLKHLIDVMLVLDLDLDLLELTVILSKTRPSHYLTKFATGCYSMLKGKNESAVQLIFKSKELNPRFLGNHLALGHTFSKSVHNLAIDTYLSCLNLGQNTDTFIFAAKQVVQKSDLELASKLYEFALRKSPNSIFALSQYADFLIRNSQEFLTAKLMLRKALQLWDKSNFNKESKLNQSMLVNLTICHVFLQEFDDALEIISKITIIHIYKETIEILSGICYTCKNEPIKALNGLGMESARSVSADINLKTRTLIKKHASGLIQSKPE